MTTTEAPYAPPKPRGFAALTPEQRVAAAKKATATRAANIAAKKMAEAASHPVAPPAVDPRDKLIAELTARLAAVPTQIVGPPVAALPATECWFEFRRNKLVAMERIYRSDDPRWAEFRTDKWAHPCHGTFGIETVSRDADGHETGRVGQTYNQLLHGPALEAMLRHETTGKHWIVGNEVKR